MASEGSYTITLSNNKTEKRAVEYLLGSDTNLLIPDTAGRKKILELLGLPKKYSRAFDLFYAPGFMQNGEEIFIADPKQITLIELKTTEKYLPQNPKGFFFGVTANEFELAEKLGDQYKFCFVSLHQDSSGHVMLTLDELKKLILTQRVQYQINL